MRYRVTSQEVWRVTVERIVEAETAEAAAKQVKEVDAVDADDHGEDDDRNYWGRIFSQTDLQVEPCISG